MRQLLCVCLWFVGMPSLLGAGDTALQEARQRWLHGNYEEAVVQYEALLKKDAASRSPASIGLSKTWQSQGEYEKALSVLDAALKDLPKDADLHARRAELLYFLGRWDEADKASREALALRPDHLLARWVGAQIVHDRGDVKKAYSQFRSFVRSYNDNDIKDPDDLVIVGLAVCEFARWRNDLSDQFHFVLNEIYGDIAKAHKDYWPAEYQAGMLLLEKYNRPEAIAALDKALAINPRAAEALVGKGILALDKFELQDAETLAERALKINPRLPAALRLRADIHLFAGEVPKALKELEQARQINPRDEATLGRIAACWFLQHKPAEAAALAKDVAQWDTKPAIFYCEMAERLEQRRWFESAEEHFKKAIDLRASFSRAQNSLGMLYMRLGREKEAQALLSQGFKADPFNVRVSNTLKVLRHLDKYTALTTKHFRLCFDPQTDQTLARYMAGYLEDIYQQLAAKFGYQPQEPILIEVFNNHDMFSGRVVAVPDLHTIGACTGRMVAMVSPYGKGIRRPFNWGRVLRHELVHVFNLEQTHFMTPHWFTEGLAVINEGYPRPALWNKLLVELVPQGKLFHLDTIDLGFMRPRSHLEWNLAYCQAQLYVQFLESKYGQEAIGAMLNAYRDGLDTPAAIERVCKVSRAEFEKGYRAYLDEVIQGIQNAPTEKAMSFIELKEAHQKDADDLDITARLAEQYLARDKVEARKLAKKVLLRKENHPLASYVLAKLDLAAGDPDHAKQLLEKALHRDQPEPKLLRLLGEIYYDANDLDRAEDIFELARKTQPYDRHWLEQLGRVYAQKGDREKQIAVLQKMAPLDADDLEGRKRVAILLSESGRHAEAERYAREALEIDIRDKDMQRLLQKSLRRQKKDAEADRLRELLEK